MGIDEKILLPKIKEVFRKRQRYAGIWEGGSKLVKERAIVCDFLRSQEAQEGREIILKVKPNPDPNAAPDCIGITNEGSSIAYEVTELVDQAMIKKTERSRPKLGNAPVPYIVKQWQPTELVTKVASILGNKDGRKYTGGRFHSIILIIYTGEPLVRYRDHGQVLMDHKFRKCTQIDEAYVLFSRHPRENDYRYVRLMLG